MYRQVPYILHPTFPNVNPSMTSDYPGDNIQNPSHNLQSPWDLPLSPAPTELPHNDFLVVLQLSKDPGLPQAFAPKLFSLPGVPSSPPTHRFSDSTTLLCPSGISCVVSYLVSVPWPLPPNESPSIFCFIAPCPLQS